MSSFFAAEFRACVYRLSDGHKSFLIFAMGIMELLHQHATFPMVAPTNAISVVPFPISFAEDSASPFSVM